MLASRSGISGFVLGTRLDPATRGRAGAHGAPTLEALGGHGLTRGHGQLRTNASNGA
jgi:hypothetical protein